MTTSPSSPPETPEGNQVQPPPEESSPEESSPSQPPRISSGTWVFVFLAVLVGFNLFIFLGSQEIWSRMVHARPPGPGVTPTWRFWETRPGLLPPPPVHTPGPKDFNLAGPELVLTLVALKNNEEVGLTAEQSKRCLDLLVRLEAPQAAMLEAARTALRCLNPQQVAWLRANRGEAQLDSTEPLEPGEDPVDSAVKRLLQSKVDKATGKADLVEHEVRDIQLHDLLHGILRLEKAGMDLAVHPNQAKTMLPLLTQAADSRKQETRLYEELFQTLSGDQIAWVQKNSDSVRMDVNQVVLRYGQLVIKQ